MNYLTAVGTFAASPSAYGIFDQGGDLFQWNDTICFGSYRWVQGGSFNNGSSALRPGYNGSGTPKFVYMGVGFRVSQVPEPASLAVLPFSVQASGCRRDRIVREPCPPPAAGMILRGMKTVASRNLTFGTNGWRLESEAECLPKELSHVGYSNESRRQSRWRKTVHVLELTPEKSSFGRFDPGVRRLSLVRRRSLSFSTNPEYHKNLNSSGSLVSVAQVAMLSKWIV